MIFVNYPKCGTCRKARNFLEEKGVSFEDRNIKENKPTAEELSAWMKRSGLPVKRFFNTSGMLYREMGLKDKLADMDEQEMIELLATDGMLVKRPILVTDDAVLVGFKEAEWENVTAKDA